MNGPFLIKLTLSTFRGMSIGAEHYYGEMNVHTKSDKFGTIKFGARSWKHPHDSIDVTKVLTEEEAAILRKKDDSIFPWAGENCARFDSRDDVIAAALRLFNRHYRHNDLLVIVDQSGERDTTRAIAGERMAEYNAVRVDQQWEWLGANGFLKDPNFYHD